MIGSSFSFNSLAQIRSRRNSVQKRLSYEADLSSSQNLVSLIIRARTLMNDRRFFDVQSVFCDEKICTVISENGFPLTNDGFHLTANGERLMMEALQAWPSFKLSLDQAHWRSKNLINQILKTLFFKMFDL